MQDLMKALAAAVSTPDQSPRNALMTQAQYRNRISHSSTHAVTAKAPEGRWRARRPDTIPSRSTPDRSSPGAPTHTRAHTDMWTFATSCVCVCVRTQNGEGGQGCVRGREVARILRADRGRPRHRERSPRGGAAQETAPTVVVMGARRRVCAGDRTRPKTALKGDASRVRGPGAPVSRYARLERICREYIHLMISPRFTMASRAPRTSRPDTAKYTCDHTHACGGGGQRTGAGTRAPV